MLRIGSKFNFKNTKNIFKKVLDNNVFTYYIMTDKKNRSP